MRLSQAYTQCIVDYMRKKTPGILLTMFFILAAAAEVARLGDGVRIFSMERLRACNIILFSRFL